MDETRYHAIAGATLEHCFTQLEEAFDAETLEELELEGGILTIQTTSGRTFLVNQHLPSRELWLASPTSGGLHFRFDDAGNRWILPDNRTLYDVLRSDLVREGVEVVL